MTLHKSLTASGPLPLGKGEFAADFGGDSPFPKGSTAFGGEGFILRGFLILYSVLRPLDYI